MEYTDRKLRILIAAFAKNWTLELKVCRYAFTASRTSSTLWLCFIFDLRSRYACFNLIFMRLNSWKSSEIRGHLNSLEPLILSYRNKVELTWMVRTTQLSNFKFSWYWTTWTTISRTKSDSFFAYNVHRQKSSDAGAKLFFFIISAYLSAPM